MLIHVIDLIISYPALHFEMPIMDQGYIYFSINYKKILLIIMLS